MKRSIELTDRAASKTPAHKPGQADKKSPEAALLATTFAATLAAASAVQAVTPTPTPALTVGTAAAPKEPGKVEKNALAATTAPVAFSPRPLPAVPPNVPPPTTGVPMPATRPSAPLSAAAVQATNAPPAASSVRPAAATIVPSVAPAKPKSPALPATSSRPDVRPSNGAPLRVSVAGKGPDSTALPIEHEQPGVSSPPPSLLSVQEPILSAGPEVAAPPTAPHTSSVLENTPEVREVRATAAEPPALRRSAGVPPATPNTATSLSAPTEVSHEAALTSSIVTVSGIEHQKPAVIASGVSNDALPGQSPDAPRQPNAPAPAHAPTIAMDGDRPASIAAYSPHQPADAGRSPSPPAPSVAEQLTHAFVAHAETLGRGGRTDFHLRLEPPQLGTVQIHLRATDHNVSARVIVAVEGTRRLLEGHAHQLRQSLAQAGLSLSGFDVSRDSGGSGGRQPPPEPMPPLPVPIMATPRPAPAMHRITRNRTDGIDILA